MALWDKLQHLLAVGALQERQVLFQADELPLDEQLLAFRRRNAYSLNPWRRMRIDEALGVPAIYRSVTLISNIGSAMTLEAYRKGILLADDQRPRLIVRPDPNPLLPPRDFFRDTIWSMAVYGEAWWWIAKRDGDGNATALVHVPSNELVVTENQRDRRRPVIHWTALNRDMPNDDMRQIILQREPGALRGAGPLQRCGAAVSVAVEADNWAANFYAEGGQPSTVIKHAGFLSGNDDADGESEAERLRKKWLSRPNNVPRIIDQDIESVEFTQPNAQGAQMLDARNHQIGEAVRMYGVPSSILGHSVAGSSLTYTNVGQELDKFIRTALKPDYLEGIEQTMSDLLTRSTVARFNVDAFVMADVKTRWEVYETASKVLGLDEAAAWARRQEGFEAGDIENAPVPFAPPDASVGPIAVRELREVRCLACGRMVAKAAGAFETRCNRCGAMVSAA